MITPEKTYTDNAFIDNALYYGKLIAMNCTIKDEKEALKNETVESLRNADILMACIEGRAKYEMFDNIPAEILEHYIALQSNLDIYAKDPQWLRNRLNSIDEIERNKMIERLSKLAQSVYIDHYDIMTKYIYDVGTDWVVENKALYGKCKSGKATYVDLFDALPMKTCLRIFRSYINSHGYLDLAILWDPESELTKNDIINIEEQLKENGDTNTATYNENIRRMLLDATYVQSVPGYSETQSDYMNQFYAYLNTRSDKNTLKTELANVSKAMRDVFISHYDMMVERKYFGYYATENLTQQSTSDGDIVYKPAWMEYVQNMDIFNLCKSGKIQWDELASYVPYRVLHNAVIYVFGNDDVNTYDLSNVYNIKTYLNEYSESPNSQRKALNEYLINDYIRNYQIYLNTSIYEACKNNTVDIFDLYEYLPDETIKSIINTEIPEDTNIEVYAKSKKMLNSYLSSIDPVKAQEIRDSICNDMVEWFPINYVEKNNYYRALLGQPPMDADGNIYEDTLTHTYHELSKTFIEFGDDMLNKCPTTLYPLYHWRRQIYMFDAHDISILNEAGIIDEYIEACGSDVNSIRYRYLKYLGDNKLDAYTIRKSSKFDLIGMPTIDDDDVRDKWIDLYKTNQEMVIYTIYDDAYSFQSDYYDRFMIIFTVLNTLIDFIISIPDYIINRTVFDYRCIKYIFEAYGIPYFPEIPVKYQKAMLKNLNMLIKYKSSTKNMLDICNIFGFADVKVFGYYMMKEHNLVANDNYALDENNDITYDLDSVYVKHKDGPIKDISGNEFWKLTEYSYYVEDYYLKTVHVLNNDGTTSEKKILNNDREDIYIYDSSLGQMIKLKDTTYFTSVKANKNPYTLKFVKVPLNETIAEYKNDEDYIMTYDDITEADDTWDGELLHSKVKQDIMDYDFNMVKTKYISIDIITSLTEIAFQASYFYNMLFDNAYSENLLTIEIPTIKTNHKFKITDIIFSMFAMTYYYMGLEDKIIYSPTQILYLKGYNFSDAINEILNDSSYFAQTDEYGKSLSDEYKYNVFNINTEIAKRDYKYREAFHNAGLMVESYNLEADIDALEQWLNDEWQMSLDDFIVSNDTETFGHILTLRHFYSLNNSLYQKNIFNGAMAPNQYNNVIKYAYDYEILDLTKILDISGIPHLYLKETIQDTTSEDIYDFILNIVALVSKSSLLMPYDVLLSRLRSVTSYDQLKDTTYVLTDIFAVNDKSEYDSIVEKMNQEFYNLIIDSSLEDVYIYNTEVYAFRNIKSVGAVETSAVYKRYLRTDDGYVSADKHYYIYDKNNNRYKALISGYIYVMREDGVLTFGSDHIYIKNSNGTYDEIDYNTYSYHDKSLNARILNFGDFYEFDSKGQYVLKEDNCYVLITNNVDGISEYVLLKDADNYVSTYIDKNDCFVKNEDGTYTQFKYTDFYERHMRNNPDEPMEYNEKELYVQVDYETDIQDPVDPTKYYRRLSDYYAAEGFAISKDTLYVKLPNGEFIAEDYILLPTNCWYYNDITNQFELVMDSQYEYLNYENPINVLYLLIKQPNYDYKKFIYDRATDSYIPVIIYNTRYVSNNNNTTIVKYDLSKTYKDTNKVMVSLNSEYLEDSKVTLSEDGFNPSLHDNVWDENDWYYDHDGYDTNNTIGMNSENIWYYHNPITVKSDEDIYDASTTVVTSETTLGSGFYFSSDNVIGSYEFTKGNEYYIGLDLYTNFTGTIQVYCTVDSKAVAGVNKIYNVYENETVHIQQSFTAKTSGKGSLRFIKYGFNNNPIHIGDFIVVSNVSFTRSYSENYIPTDLPDIDTLTNIYKTNKTIHKYLLTQMHNTHDKRTYDIYKKLYDALMVADYNREIFKQTDNTYSLTYTEFMKNRDSILYELLVSLKDQETDTMKQNISNYIVDMCYALNDFIKGEDFTYLYAYFPGMGISFAQSYLYTVVNWFKSWKVHLLGINTSYKLGTGSNTDISGNILADIDGDDFSVKILHDRVQHHSMEIYLKESFIKDQLKIQPDGYSPSGDLYEDKYDMNDHIYKNEDIPLRHRIRIITHEGNNIKYDDNEKDMHIILNDHSSNIKVKNNNILTISTINGDEFECINNNELQMRTDEDPNDVFLGQIISEINLLSGDYITSPKEDQSNE